MNEKKQELQNLAQAIDIWLSAPMSADKSNKINHLFDELKKQLDELDEQYLDAKLTAYREIYKQLKENDNPPTS